VPPPLDAAARSGPPPEVVTLGEVLAALLAPTGLPLAAATTLDVTFAGAEANVAVGLSRLGHRVAHLGRVGADPLGEGALACLRAGGVDVGQMRIDPGRPTGLLLRDVVTSRPISVQYHRSGSAGSALCDADVMPDVVADARLLHLSGITPALSSSARSACRRAVEEARAAGTVVSFDPNVRLRIAPRDHWNGIVREFAGFADIVLTGADDARTALDVTDPADAAAWFHDRGATVVVVKDGPHGAWESSDGQVVRQPARPVPVVDPVGAGDAFAAGWLSGWLRGHPAEERMRAATAVASCVVSTPGDLAGLPTAAVLDTLLNQGTDVRR